MSRSAVIIAIGVVAAVLLGVALPSVLAGGISVNTTALVVVVVVTILAVGLLGRAARRK
ncbi:hypothetical protein AB0G02_32410 [Actinosynnema sp. NPDC023658]|uniref:hypothetical protein n=1 Tax=Actinosynnema sp. NPDC023658 TaxID=3155465 RepID=UPI0033DCCA71